MHVGSLLRAEFALHLTDLKGKVIRGMQTAVLIQNLLVFILDLLIHVLPLCAKKVLESWTNSCRYSNSVVNAGINCSKARQICDMKPNINVMIFNVTSFQESTKCSLVIAQLM